MNKRPVVSVESPYRAATAELQQEHVCYAVLAAKHASKFHGEAPFASHLILTQSVDHSGGTFYCSDDMPEPHGLGVGREGAIEITHSARMVCDKIVLYTDYGVSSGMKAAVTVAEEHGIPIEYRQLPPEMLKLCKAQAKQ